ncbi:hypothetical protein V8F06_014079 [Rhypophila decipiens]
MAGCRCHWDWGVHLLHDAVRSSGISLVGPAVLLHQTAPGDNGTYLANTVIVLSPPDRILIFRIQNSTQRRRIITPQSPPLVTPRLPQITVLLCRHFNARLGNNNLLITGFVVFKGNRHSHYVHDPPPRNELDHSGGVCIPIAGVLHPPGQRGGATRRPAVSVPITILTGTVYILSSIIFWTLYSDLPLQTRSGTGIGDANDMYRLYRLQLSSLPACGGYSGLAACPFESKQRATAVEQGLDARKKLRVLAPIIWGWSTFVFVGLVGTQVYHAIMSGRGSARRALQGVVTHVDGQSKQGENQKTEFGFEAHMGAKDSEGLIGPGPGLKKVSSRWWAAGFWLTTLGFLAGVGMQLAVLWTAKLLGMVNDQDWGFGQIVAVTIWIPPLLEYFFEEIELVARISREGKIRRVGRM